MYRNIISADRDAVAESSPNTARSSLRFNVDPVGEIHSDVTGERARRFPEANLDVLEPRRASLSRALATPVRLS
jgi:hypothetical protein